MARSTCCPHAQPDDPDSVQATTPTVAVPVPPAPPAIVGQAAPSAREMYDAARAFRRELVNQQERIQDQREEIVQELQQTGAGAPERAGLEARLKDLDARNAALEQQITEADQRVANAAAVPGATAEPPRVIVNRGGPPEEAWVLGGFFIVCVMMPIAIAYARRLWKRPVAGPVELPAELGDRLSRLEQAVDAVAVELERVGEGQRFLTRALGPGAAQPIDVRAREGVHQARP